MKKKYIAAIVAAVGLLTAFLAACSPLPPDDQSTSTPDNSPSTSTPNDEQSTPTPTALDDGQAALADIGKNEDPAIMIARDGVPHVVWFSDRAGSSDIWLTKLKGEVWSEPIQVTTDPVAEFYPTLAQDEDGLFHLVWFKTVPNFEIMYSTSSDTVEWSPPIQITDDPGADWTPTVAAYNDDIFIAWASTRDGDKEIFVRGLGGVTTQVTRDENADDFPFIFKMDGKLAMVWNDWDATDQNSLFPTPGSPIVISTSEDGIDWDEPTTLVQDAGKVSMLPSVHTRDGEHFLTWTSNRDDVFGDIVEAPLSDPGNVRRLTSNFFPDYSGRVARDILVWVADPERNGADLHIFYKIIE